VLVAVDFDFRLINGDFLTIPAVRLEAVLQPMGPVSDRFIRSVNERFDPVIREVSMVQKRRKDTPLVGVSSRQNTSYWQAFSTMRSSIACTNLTLARPVPFL